MVEIIVALDLPVRTAALRLLDRLPAARWVKVGSILGTREGAPLVRELVGRGLQVFLDLKWHDIPNTVAGAVSAAGDLGVTMATVHTLAGMAMLRAAAEAAGDRIGLVGVTVLTSENDASYAETLARPGVVVAEEVQRLTARAQAARLRGVVCSPHETASARAELGPEAWVVVPGIRRATDHRGDQTRTATPAEAARAGASHLVVGRPIIQAPDPAAVLDQLIEETAC
jgi:orotidine-5'-phosphate decarboxylase